MSGRAADPMLELMLEAVEAWPLLDDCPDEVKAEDLVTWFAEWRERAKLAILEMVNRDAVNGSEGGCP